MNVQSGIVSAIVPKGCNVWQVLNGLTPGQSYYLSFYYVKMVFSDITFSVDGHDFLVLSGLPSSNMISSSSWTASGSIGNSFTATASSMKLSINVPGSSKDYFLLLDSLEVICLYCVDPGGVCVFNFTVNSMFLKYLIIKITALSIFNAL
jgi:hypothetical protein